jgi:hypothetical protein
MAIFTASTLGLIFRARTFWRSPAYAGGKMAGAVKRAVDSDRVMNILLFIDSSLSRGKSIRIFPELINVRSGEP